MRKKLLLYGAVFSVLLCSSLIASVKAASTWSHEYEGPTNVKDCLVVATSDGGYALVCTIDPFDVWLAKIDALGNMEWNRTYGGTGPDWVSSMVATSDGGFAIVGGTWSFGAGSSDFWLVKTDAFGNAEWNRTYGGDSHEEATSVVETSDGGYAITGHTYASESEPIMLVKTDASGNMQWNKTYEKIFGIDSPLSIFATPGGGYAITSNFWLMKTDAFGNRESNRTFEGLDADSVVMTPDGGFALAGYTVNYTGQPMIFSLSSTDWGEHMKGNRTYGESSVRFSLEASKEVYTMADETSSLIVDLWLAKTDAVGNMLWNRTYGLDERRLIGTTFSLVATFDGGYAIAGSTTAFDFLGDFLLVKTDAVGNMLWNRTYGENLTANEACSLIQTSDGGYAICGRISSSSSLWVDSLWLVKADELGVVPEYSSWLVPALALTATAFLIIKAGRKRRRAF
jgi:hypothetical protein